MSVILLSFAAICGQSRFANAGDQPKLLWKFSTNGLVLGLALGHDHAIYAGTWADPVIYVLSPKGTLLRQVSVGNNYGVARLAVGNDGTIYAESEDGWTPVCSFARWDCHVESRRRGTSRRGGARRQNLRRFVRV